MCIPIVALTAARYYLWSDTREGGSFSFVRSELTYGCATCFK